jgi:hypothetical protein
MFGEGAMSNKFELCRHDVIARHCEQCNDELRTKKLKLTQREYDAVLMALGYATGAAQREGHDGMVNMFLRATNAVGRSSPDFVPYAVEDEPEEPR